MFRKILALFMALTILTCSAGLAATLDETQLKSKSCILMDAATGEVLYGRAADVRRSPASTTKIMTLLIAISKSDPDEIGHRARLGGAGFRWIPPWCRCTRGRRCRCAICGTA